MQYILLERSFPHNKRINAVCLTYHTQCLIDLSFPVLIQHRILDPHRIQQRQRHLALLHMLRFVMHSRLSAPTDHQQQRHPVHIRIHQTQQRIHRIAFTRVLHVHASRISRRQMVTGSQCHRTTLVRSNDIVLTTHIVRDVRTEVLQQRVRHSGKELYTTFAQTLYELFRFNHCFVPGINVNISLIGMQYSSLASLHRPCSRMLSAQCTIAGYAERSMWFA